jgi:hypothetical protein
MKQTSDAMSAVCAFSYEHSLPGVKIKTFYRSLSGGRLQNCVN